MACQLNKFTTYSVGQVYFNKQNNQMTVQLSDPPASCPDKAFVSHEGEIQVVKGAAPSLGYDSVKNKPILIVPDIDVIKEPVVTQATTGWVQHEKTEPSGHFFYYLCVVLFTFATIYAVYRLCKRMVDDEQDDDGGGGGIKVGQTSSSYKNEDFVSKSDLYQPKASVTTQASLLPAAIDDKRPHGNDTFGPFMTGILIGQTLSRDNYPDSPNVKEPAHDVSLASPSTSAPCPATQKEHLPQSIEPQTSNNGLTVDSGSPFLSDSGLSSFSSDSGNSSFSSDSGNSSFSSDSSSSFSSDSGSF